MPLPPNITLSYGPLLLILLIDGEEPVLCACIRNEQEELLLHDNDWPANWILASITVLTQMVLASGENDFIFLLADQRLEVQTRTNLSDLEP